MKNLVLLSGGMDSAVAFGQSAARGHETSAVSFMYGQRHRRELESASLVVAYYRRLYLDQIKEHYVLDLSGAFAAFKGSALTGGGSVPEGHYADESMKQTVVPNRNMTLLSLAAGVAIANKLESVIYGAHAGDHAIYPDCRPEFYDLVSTTIRAGNYNPPSVIAPFLNMTKTSIARTGSLLEVPFELTWSCYKGGDVHCGRCGTCVERKEAFSEAGIEDPTEYGS